MQRLILPIGTTLLLGLCAVLFASHQHNIPSVTAGRDLYEANGCASCHGLSGHGDGILAGELPSKPIDFRDASAFTRGGSEDDTVETLLEDTMMPRFDHLSETERRSIALYVISIRSKGPKRNIRP